MAGTVTGRASNRWAKDEEYTIPFYQEVAAKMAEIHAYTGSRKRDPHGAHPHTGMYADGLYWSRQWEYPWALESAELVQPDGKPVDDIKELKVLDVGCGHAPFLVYLGQMGCQAYGSDPGADKSSVRIDGLWGYFDANFGKPWVKELRQEGMEKLSWPDNYFDRVFCLSVIEHVSPSAAKAGVKKMKRVLKPGGLLVISVDNGERHELIINTAQMPFYGGQDAKQPGPCPFPHIYAILGMVFQKP